MYYKFIDEFNIIEAPKSIIIDGKTILNFNKSINYMLKYGYKPLVNSGVLDYNPMYQEKVYMYVNKPDCIIEECYIVDNIDLYKKNLVILLDKWLTQQKDLPIFISQNRFTKIRWIEDYFNTLCVINDINYTFDDKHPLKLILGTLDGIFEEVKIDSFKKAKNIYDKTYNVYNDTINVYNCMIKDIFNCDTIEVLRDIEGIINQLKDCI